MTAERVASRSGRTPEVRQSNTVTTTIKRQYFAEIVDGSKRIEYRECKPYWTKKLSELQTPFRLVLRNGMRPPVPVVTVRIDRIGPSPGGRGRKSERRSKADAAHGRLARRRRASGERKIVAG